MMPTVAIIGANAGLHLVLKVNNGMPEEQLIQRAKERGVQVYGVSRYFSNSVPAEYQDVVVLGFATMNLSKITPAIALLKRAWIE
jgi:GntR family transcriptional regulator/MocR family aminotransferase